MKNQHRPNCDESERYALQLKIGQLFVMSATPFETTPDPEKAKIFSGGYLNSTKWDWTHDCEALPIKKPLKTPQNALKRPTGLQKGKIDTKSQQTSKRR